MRCRVSACGSAPSQRNDRHAACSASARASASVGVERGADQVDADVAPVGAAALRRAARSAGLSRPAGGRRRSACSTRRRRRCGPARRRRLEDHAGLVAQRRRQRLDALAPAAPPGAWRSRSDACADGIVDGCRGTDRCRSARRCRAARVAAAVRPRPTSAERRACSAINASQGSPCHAGDHPGVKIGVAAAWPSAMRSASCRCWLRPARGWRSARWVGGLQRSRASARARGRLEHEGAGKSARPVTPARRCCAAPARSCCRWR